jgi:hypothetical protein
MNADTIHFLNCLFTGTRGFFELTLIHPTRDKGRNIQSSAYALGRDKIDWARVEAMNRAGWGVYYGTTTSRRRPAAGHRRTEQDAYIIPCLWSEFDLKSGDFADLDTLIGHVRSFDFPPSFLIASGGGIHAIWWIAPVEITSSNRAAIKETLRGLAIHLHADTAATDLARVLRLPGTINTKPERHGARCQIIDALECQYQLADFADYRAYARPVRRDPVTPATAPPDRLPHYLRWFLTTAPPTGQRNARLNWTAWKMRIDGFSLIDAEAYLLPRALACGLSEREALATIRSPYRK